MYQNDSVVEWIESSIVIRKRESNNSWNYDSSQNYT